MGKLQVLENGISTMWKWGKSKIDPNKMRYVPNKNMSVPKDLPIDEFVRTTTQNAENKNIKDAFSYLYD